jgi:glycosyltransferase involved in cell wall biosynthesis
MTRVLMVVDGLWNGGAERQLTLLASSLPEGWSASVLSMEDGPYRQVLEELGIDVRLVEREFRYDITPAVRMWRAAAEIHPDVVHSWGWMSALAMVPFCRTHRVPLVNATIQFGCLPPRGAGMFRLGMRLSDAIVANSRAGLAAFGLAEGERDHVVYNGFDATRLATVTLDRRGAPTRERTVAIMAARMSPAKDWRLLMDVARVLAEDEGGWRFIAMGDGPVRNDLMKEAADLVSAGVVAFPPGVPEALPAIADADAGVLLTDPDTNAAEGCSNAIMEYMACGLPVVCTDSGGNPELVEDGITGFLVTPKDAGAVVSALRTLRDDPERAREMGREGRRRVEARFSVARMTANYVAVYESVFAAGRGGGS